MMPCRSEKAGNAAVGGRGVWSFSLREVGAIGVSRQLSDFGYTNCRNSVALQVREIGYENHKEAYVSCVGERVRAWQFKFLSLRYVSQHGCQESY